MSESLFLTQYEVPQNGCTFGISIPRSASARPVRLTVQAEDGIVDYVFDLTFEQSLSIAEAILHGARLRAL